MVHCEKCGKKVEGIPFKCQAQCPIVTEDGVQRLSRECKAGCRYDEAARIEVVMKITPECRAKSSLIENDISVCNEMDKACLNQVISRYGG